MWRSSDKYRLGEAASQLAYTCSGQAVDGQWRRSRRRLCCTLVWLGVRRMVGEASRRRLRALLEVDVVRGEGSNERRSLD